MQQRSSYTATSASHATLAIRERDDTAPVVTPRSGVVAVASWFFLVCSVASPGAKAQTVDVASPVVASVPRDVPRFSLGAGFGFSVDAGGTGLGSLGAIGNGSTTAAVTPTGSALFELAATRSVRLMLGASGNYSKRVHAKSDVPDTSPESRWILGGGVGVRWVLNPGGVVELSPALLLGMHGGRVNQYVGSVRETNGISYMTRYDEVSLGVDGRLGIVLERALLPNLHLRFEAYFLRGGYDRFASRTNGVITRHARAGLGWGLAPSLVLRLSI
jgi:hypothetical protein